MTAPNESFLSPVERRILAMATQGLEHTEIAVKFRRSPRYVRQVLEIAKLREGRASLSGSGAEERRAPRRGSVGGKALTPRQRVVVKWRDRGASYAEIASRLRRSPSYVRRIESLALSRPS